MEGLGGLGINGCPGTKNKSGRSLGLPVRTDRGVGEGKTRLIRKGKGKKEEGTSALAGWNQSLVRGLDWGLRSQSGRGSLQPA